MSLECPSRSLFVQVSRDPINPNFDITSPQCIFGRYVFFLLFPLLVSPAFLFVPSNPDSDIKFPSNKAISGHHCRIWRNGDGQVFLEDLSTNGTFVGGVCARLGLAWLAFRVHLRVGVQEKIGKNKSIPIRSGTEFTLIPRGPGRPKVSYTLYIQSEEVEKEARAPDSSAGPITCVFTDVQGSTKLWETTPEAMDAGLRLHDRLLRKLLKRFGGYEVKTEGDAFFVVFGSVLQAMRW